MPKTINPNPFRGTLAQYYKWREEGFERARTKTEFDSFEQCEFRMDSWKGLSYEDQETNYKIIKKWREQYKYNPDINSGMSKNEYYEFLERLISNEKFCKLRGSLF